MCADVTKIFDVIVCEPKPSWADALMDFMRLGIKVRKRLGNGISHAFWLKLEKLECLAKHLIIHKNPYRRIVVIIFIMTNVVPFIITVPFFRPT